MYNTYFSSIGRILLTTISLIEDRINTHWSKESFLWNMGNKSPLTSLWIDLRYSDMIDKFPNYSSLNNRGFTAIITVSRMISYHMNKFIKVSLLPSRYLRKILILWTIKSPVLPQILHLANNHPSIIVIEVIENGENYNGNKFTCCYNHSAVITDAIFHFDPESNLITEEVWKCSVFILFLLTYTIFRLILLIWSGNHFRRDLLALV